MEALRAESAAALQSAAGRFAAAVSRQAAQAAELHEHHRERVRADEATQAAVLELAARERGLLLSLAQSEAEAEQMERAAASSRDSVCVLRDELRALAESSKAQLTALDRKMI